MKETEMKTQPTTTRRESLLCRLFFLLVLATFSPATLVFAQTPRNPEKDLGALMATMKEQQEQIKRQQKEIDSLKLGQPGDGGNVAGTIVGSGTPVKRVISVTKSIVFSNPNDTWVDVSVPGAQPTDLVLIGVTDQLFGKRVFTGTVDKTDNVRVRIYTSMPVPAIPTLPILVRVVVVGF
jgi:DNA-binding protein YbaB